MKHIKCYIAILSMLFFLTAICITSCTKDYGPEIDKIKTDVSNLQTSVDKLKEAYENGKIIVSVEPLSFVSGVWKVTFSDESIIYLQNGSNGTDGVNGIDGADGVTPYVKIDNNCNWVVSYDNRATFSPILDANGNPISARGVDADSGISVDVRVNDEGNYEIVTYVDDINTPLTVVSTPYSANVANQIASIVEDSESGKITITMTNGQKYNFGQVLNYPTSIIIIDEEVIVSEAEGTAEIEVRINPSNAKITKEDIVIDQVNLTEELRSYANPTPNYEILSMANSLNSDEEEIQGQYKLTIKHKGDRGIYRETCTFVLSTRDAQNNEIEISSEKFYLISQVPYSVVVETGEGGTAEASESEVLCNGEVTLTATPEYGYHFVNWTLNEEEISTENPYTATVTANSTYVATFAKNIYAVSVSSSTGGSAEISETSVEYGGDVVLTATSEYGYHFFNWTLNEEEISTENPYTATVIDNSNYIANFAKNVYSVSVSSNTGGTVVAASNSVEYGDNVTLTAIPDEGYIFVNWTHNGSIVSNSKTYAPTVTANSTYVATFEKIICAVSVSSNTGGTATVSSTSVEYGGSVTLTATPNDGYSFVNWTVNGVEVSKENPYTVAVTSDIEFKANFKGEENGHEYVDLGLSVKWATCNVGANTPEEYGDSFAWGETSPKTTYDWSTYKYCNGDEYSMTKYCTSSSDGTVDNKTTLELTDDAAHVNWGGKWRMPTKAEQEELMSSSNCTWTWTTQNGVNGYKVTSKKNGNSVFLPATSSHGFYWSSVGCNSNAWFVYFNSDEVGLDCGLSRYQGLSVRAVCE